jgi:FkbM family methyltransferase
MLIEPMELLKLMLKHKVSIRGILHLGAHLCEERHVYNTVLDIKDENIIWVDALEDITNINRHAGIPNCYTAILDEVERDTTFKVTRNVNATNINVQSSSLLELGTHKYDHPDIVVIAEIPVRTQTLQQFIDRNQIDIARFNFWNLDLQGSDLHVLRGSRNLMKNVDCIYIEINTKEVYKGCGQITEMDAFLSEEGFTCVFKYVYDSLGWGDAVYVRKV